MLQGRLQQDGNDTVEALPRCLRYEPRYTNGQPSLP